MYSKIVEDERGQCECYKSQDVTKIIRIWAASNQLTDGGRGGEYFRGDSEYVDVCQRGCTVLCIKPQSNSVST
jgi:hypothetical protein